MDTVAQQRFTGERALFKARDLTITDSVFDNGESPLKESARISIDDSIFRWKYPLWYCRDITVANSAFLTMARAGIWYTRDVDLVNCTYQAPKGIRRCSDVTITDTAFTDAQETLWWNERITLANVTASGDYFAKDCTDIRVTGLRLVGNYAFDSCRNVLVEDSHLLAKDAFWNCENVIVRNSFITGEYLGWNTRALTLENCTIESLQGLCYVNGLTMRNCRLINTTLAFEYCTDIDAEITTTVDSILNPVNGRIRAAGFGQITIDDPDIDPARTRLITE
ncbi:DUF3737 family protein [Actinomyces mediterranea]|uniref:DUF3737 family protein n=1 Tax=Actinomyces mediterranea TaxID=1871028 RepID=UPI0009710361|nr:DUF3737 family protein [Actinomyces mediterranea]